MENNINDSLNKLTDSLMHFIDPRRCPFCGLMVGKELICEHCKNTLPFCNEIREDPEFKRVTAPLYYEGSVKTALDNFVLKGKCENLSCFGALMAQCAAERYEGQFDAISFVPYNKKERRQRHDAPRYLCASICVDWHCEPLEALKKENETITAMNPEQIKGKKILLIDDMVESGGTLRKCAKLLLEAGAEDVMCLTLALLR